MTYDINVLEKMISNYTRNIKMFSEYIIKDTKGKKYLEEKNESTLSRMADMVGNRRFIASIIENGGDSTVPNTFRNGNIFFDYMLYMACAGADIK